MEQYLRQREQENERRKSLVINKYESPIRKIYEPPMYILILDANERFFEPILKEFEKFGEFKEVKNDENFRYILISYHNPEHARIAFEHHNPFCLDTYSKRNKINVKLITEIQKNDFIKNIHEENYLIDEKELGKGRVNMRYNLPNARDYNYSKIMMEKPKSNWQKFVEVLLNL